MSALVFSVVAPTSSEIDLGVVVDVAPNLHIGHDGKGLNGDRFIVEMEEGKKVIIDMVITMLLRVMKITIIMMLNAK